MNVLIVYYSRTGITRNIAEQIQTALNGDIDEIKDSTGRSGIIGWLRSGRDSMSKNLTQIKEVDANPIDYDIVIIGTPTWNGAASTPIRTYITEYKKNLPQVALFSTGASDKLKAIEEIKPLINDKPIATLHLIKKEDIDKGNYHSKIDDFIKKIKIRAG
jgi:flavodoxin